MPPLSSAVAAPFSDIEREVIVLYAVWDMIDEMVNYAMFERNEQHQNTNLMFCTSTHTRLFNILLTDFLSVPQRNRETNHLPFDLPAPPRNGLPSERTYLFYLRKICDTSLLGRNTAEIRDVVQGFSDWLNTECTVEDVWLAEISVKANVRASRIALLKICGNIGKHNFSRLTANIDDIMKILAHSGEVITEQDAFQALPSFYEWFHRNFFVYHSSTIAEFLNNLRWAIYRYLQPEFKRSYRRLPDDEIAYGFDYPAGCEQPLARAMYWDLMNHVRSRPFFPQFTVSRSFKTQY